MPPGAQFPDDVRSNDALIIEAENHGCVTKGRIGGIGRHAWTIAGTVFVGLGAIGLLLPVMPTTPFLLLAAGCYAKGSPRAYRWLMENHLFGRYLKGYWEGRGLPTWVKAASIFAVLASVSFSIFLTGMRPLPTVILIVVAVVVIVHLLTLPNPSKNGPDGGAS